MAFYFGFLWYFVLFFCDNMTLSHDYIIIRYMFLTSCSVVKFFFTTEISLIHVRPHDSYLLLFHLRQLVRKHPKKYPLHALGFDCSFALAITLKA